MTERLAGNCQAFFLCRLSMAPTIPRRIHEAALFLQADYRTLKRAITEADRRCMKAKSLDLDDEWNYWGHVMAYLSVKDSGVHYEIVDKQ